MKTKLPLVIGTANRKKGRELADLLEPLGLEVRTLADFPGILQVEEDGDTFAANARLKATGYARQMHHWVLADDSGLAVDFLHGAPGVLSARYAGPGANDELNNRRLLEELKAAAPADRTARFVCHMALADPAGAICAEAEGYCRGRILSEKRGTAGFGYDPLFEIVEYHRSFGELEAVVKSCLSHRARAIRGIIPKLVALVDSGEWEAGL